MFGSVGPLEILLIFIIILLVFGADKLPSLARTIGKGVGQFKKAADEVKKEFMFDSDLNIDLNQPTPEERRRAEAAYQSEAAKPIESQPVSSAASATGNSNQTEPQTDASIKSDGMPTAPQQKPKRSKRPSHSKSKQATPAAGSLPDEQSPKPPLLG